MGTASRTKGQKSSAGKELHPARAVLGALLLKGVQASKSEYASL